MLFLVQLGYPALRGSVHKLVSPSDLYHSIRILFKTVLNSFLNSLLFYHNHTPAFAEDHGHRQHGWRDEAVSIMLPRFISVY